MPRKIPSSLVKSYNSAIKRQGGAAEREARRALEAFFSENPGASVGDAREFAIDVMRAAADLYGNACSQAALELQDEIAREFGSKPPDVGGWYYEPDAKSLVKTARLQAGKLSGGDREGFIREISSASRFYAERGANSAMMQTAREQSKPGGSKRKRKGTAAYGVRFARVPQGSTTCGFCFMLASRGFVYLTEETAGEFDRFHKHCDCRIVPGYPGMELEGYDYEGMYDRWKKCEETIGVEEGWSYLRRAETIKEAEKRDSKWLLTGETPRVDTSAIDVALLNDEQKRVFDKEMNCAQVLATSGFRVALLDDPNRKPIPNEPKFDYSIGTSNALWEAKCPEGNGYLAVAGNIAKADAKFRKIGKESMIVMSNLDSAMTDNQFWDFFEESLSDPESDYSNVREILFVFKGGSVRRWLKK